MSTQGKTRTDREIFEASIKATFVACANPVKDHLGNMCLGTVISPLGRVMAAMHYGDRGLEPGIEFPNGIAHTLFDEDGLPPSWRSAAKAYQAAYEAVLARKIALTPQ